MNTLEKFRKDIEEVEKVILNSIGKESVVVSKILKDTNYKASIIRIAVWNLVRQNKIMMDKLYHIKQK